MPESDSKLTIESQLVEAVHSLRDRYKAGQCDAEEYVNALKRLNDFLIDGKRPNDLKPETAE